MRVTINPSCEEESVLAAKPASTKTAIMMESRSRGTNLRTLEVLLSIISIVLLGVLKSLTPGFLTCDAALNV